MSLDEAFIAAWRASAPDPGRADEDELALRRHDANHEAEIAALPRSGKPVTSGQLDRLAATIGHETGVSDQLVRRQLAKTIAEETAALRSYIAALEARVTKLEARSYPRGGR